VTMHERIRVSNIVDSSFTSNTALLVCIKQYSLHMWLTSHQIPKGGGLFIDCNAQSESMTFFVMGASFDNNIGIIAFAQKSRSSN